MSSFRRFPFSGLFGHCFSRSKIVCNVPLMRKICFTTFICTYLYVNSGASQVEIVVKNTPVYAGDLRDMSLIPGLGRSPGEGNGNPLHYSCLENAMDRGAWWSTVHTAAKRQAGPKWFSTHRHTYANSAWNTTFKIQSDWKTMFKLHTCSPTYFTFNFVSLWAFSHFMANRWGNNGNSVWLYFLGFQNHCRLWYTHEIKRCLLLGRKAMTNQDSVLKSRDIALPTKVHLVKEMVFPVVMYGYELDLKNWCFWTVVMEKTLESPLDSKQIRLVNHKGNQSWIFIGKTDVEAEAPLFWPPDANNWLIRKDPDTGKDWRREEKGMTEYEMVGWHHWLNGHEFEKAPGVGGGQGSLACCSSWRCRVRHDWSTELTDW